MRSAELKIINAFQSHYTILLIDDDFHRARRFEYNLKNGSVYKWLMNRNTNKNRRRLFVFEYKND